jgi:spore germination protein YaaH
LTVDLPMNEQAYDYEQVGRIANAVVAMGYDQHWASGAPGPVAGVDWYAEAIDNLAQRVPARKLIAAVGGYGYDWDVTDHRPAEPLSFADAMRIAADRGIDIDTEPASVNSHFAYTDDAGHHHQVHFLDAVSAWDQYRVGRAHGLTGSAASRCGGWDWRSRRSGRSCHWIGPTASTRPAWPRWPAVTASPSRGTANCCA